MARRALPCIPTASEKRSHLVLSAVSNQRLYLSSHSLPSLHPTTLPSQRWIQGSAGHQYADIKAARPRPTEKPAAKLVVTWELSPWGLLCSLVHTLPWIISVPWLYPTNPVSSPFSTSPPPLLFIYLKQSLLFPTKASNSLCSQGWP